jgi:hypothetical protein
MPQTPVSVPPFPNVPNVPGVPPLLRSAVGAANVLSGTLQGVRDAASGQFTGALQGVLLLSNGQAGPVLGTLRGILDGSGNLTAILSGGIAGQAIGTFAGIIGAAGQISGTINTLLSQVTGTLGASDGAAVAAQAEPFRWGIFKAALNAPVVVADSVEAFEEQKEYRVIDYPLEDGAFESYNKVEVPQEIRFTFKKSGTLAERTAFLVTVDNALKSLDLYDAVTPEATYLDISLVRREMRRTAEKGAQMLTVDVVARQVRNTAVTTFTSSKAPSAAATANSGPVQPGPAPASAPDPAAFVPSPGVA